MQVCLVEPLGTAQVPEYPEALNSAPNEGHPLELFFQSEVEGSVLESTSSWLCIEYMFYVTYSHICTCTNIYTPKQFLVILRGQH